MDYSDLVYISEELGNSLSRTQVTNGDIVISQRGSLGQCAIIEDTFEKLNISANIIAIKNIKGTTAEFIHDYILSSIGQMQLERSASGQVQQKITTQDISDILIPVNCDEKNLTDIIKTANNQYNEKIKKADALLRCTADIVLSKISIETKRIPRSLCSAISLSTLKKDKVFSVEYYHPERIEAIKAIKNCGYKSFKLSEIVDFCRDTILPKDSSHIYLGLASVESNTGERNFNIETANGQAFAYKKEDILYARLRPYLNKVFFADKDGICSTEFHVLRVKQTVDVIPEFIAIVLRSSIILSQTKHMMTGNTHPRISDEDVKKLYIPVPDISVQKEIVRESNELIKNSRDLRISANAEWQAAKAQFEKDLLGE